MSTRGVFGVTGPKPYQGYTLDELRYRSIEHILEALGSRQLGAALEINKDKAAAIKRDPSAFVDTEFEMDDAKVAKVRRWLSQQ